MLGAAIISATGLWWAEGLFVASCIVAVFAQVLALDLYSRAGRTAAARSAFRFAGSALFIISFGLPAIRREGQLLSYGPIMTGLDLLIGKGGALHQTIVWLLSVSMSVIYAWSWTMPCARFGNLGAVEPDHLPFATWLLAFASIVMMTIYVFSVADLEGSVAGAIGPGCILWCASLICLVLFAHWNGGAARQRRLPPSH